MNRYNGAQATPLDDVRLYERILGNGILTGCALTHLGTNQVRITAGAGILKGRDYEVAQETLLVGLATSGTMPGRIYVRCNLADTVTPIKFMSVCAATLPALVQDSTFNESNGIWEEELATYTASTTVISNLTTTYTNINSVIPTPITTLESLIANTTAGKLVDALLVKFLHDIQTYTVLKTDWTLSGGLYIKTQTLTGLTISHKLASWVSSATVPATAIILGTFILFFTMSK